MKKFFVDHSYDMVKMFLNQFAIAIFGFSLSLAAGKAENIALRNFASVFSILFYLFLLYVMTWDIGYRDKISIDVGKKKHNPWKGALISLCANSVNFLLAIFITLMLCFDIPTLESIGSVSSFIALLIEGMYTGILANSIGGIPLNALWFIYFLIPIPAIIVCGISYNFGAHDVKFTSVFNKQAYPESDREPKQKRD